MRLYCQPLLFSLLLPSLHGSDLLVSGARLPPRWNLNLAARAISQNKVEVPGLQFLTQYACPNATNVKGNDTVSVPIDQLGTVLLRLLQMEQDVIALIGKYNAEGRLNSTGPSGVFVGADGVEVIAASDSVAAASSSGSTNSKDSNTDVAVSARNSSGPSAVLSLDDPGSPQVSATDVSAASSKASPDSAVSSTDSVVSAQTTSAPSAVPSLVDPGSPQISKTNYTFNAQSSKNVAVYFGQSPVTSDTTLALQCADPDIDIVILAFVTASSDGGQYPQINFGPACGGQTAEMASDAPGLLSCPQLAADITTCQTKYGKKVFLSIGGATGQISFTTAASAGSFATMLWNLFGPPGNIDSGLRPFGDVQLDGFDVDNEDALSANWEAFATTMRTLFASTPSKTYYLSAAPQCPYPDASDPQALLLLTDFVWVQFYNNPSCQIGSAGFVASLQQWSTALLASELPVKPKLYFGAPAFSDAGPVAYEAIGNAEGMQGVVESVVGLGLSNFGGVMFWDGPEAMLNTCNGKDILGWAKAGLTS
ncbi:Chitinase 3 [Hyphodiscus hymeniophilus]|uniref:chitinase n=1 Tax=Hyphodiscus hymeniophilus TaxID=353542 RepID=A0A9P6VQ34_9HELO|nr:Chitinase 3 [Hyphodiscus hymeniophilus]